MSYKTLGLVPRDITSKPLPLNAASSLLENSQRSLNSLCPSPSPKLPGDLRLENVLAGRLVTPVVLSCCGVNRLVVRLSRSQMQKSVIVSLTSLRSVSFLRDFFRSLFSKNKCCFGPPTMPTSVALAKHAKQRKILHNIPQTPCPCNWRMGSTTNIRPPPPATPRHTNRTNTNTIHDTRTLLV